MKFAVEYPRQMPAREIISVRICVM